VADPLAGLRAAVHRFIQRAASAPEAMETHPVFGPIGMAEWARAHVKHAYHHLLQFGALDAEV